MNTVLKRLSELTGRVYWWWINLDLSRMIDTPIMTRLLPVSRQHRMLDLCCGRGHQMETFASQCSLWGGIDLSKNSLINAHHRAQEANLLNVFLVCGDACHLPFKSGIFDAVLCNCAMEHIPDDNAVVCEVARCLRVGGIFAVTVPHYDGFGRSSFFAWILKWPKFVKRVFLRSRIRYSNIDLYNISDLQVIVKKLKLSLQHYHIYTRSSLEELFSRHDLEVTEFLYFEKAFGQLAQLFKYSFALTSNRLSILLLYVLALLDIFDRRDDGQTIGVRAIKRTGN